MARKIFISYKYADDSVLPIYGGTTPRAYVDYIQDKILADTEINKGEKDGEDLSKFTDETISSKLRDKIWDSSITLVLLSPNMMEKNIDESEQWIPWELSYSLKIQKRGERYSGMNAILGIVLPDINGSYNYVIGSDNYIDEAGDERFCRLIDTSNTFQIIRNNTFNQKHPNIYFDKINGKTIYRGDSSYIKLITWDEFKESPDVYLDKAVEIKEKSDDYEIQKDVLKD